MKACKENVVVVSSLRFNGLERVDLWYIIITFLTKERSGNAVAFFCCCKSHRSDGIPTADQIMSFQGVPIGSAFAQKKMPFKVNSSLGTPQWTVPLRRFLELFGLKTPTGTTASPI